MEKFLRYFIAKYRFLWNVFSSKYGKKEKKSIEGEYVDSERILDYIFIDIFLHINETLYETDENGNSVMIHSSVPTHIGFLTVTIGLSMADLCHHPRIFLILNPKILSNLQQNLL